MKDRSRETVLIGGPENREIVIVDYDPSWPKRFEEHARRIRDALEGKAISIEHVGSTSVPGLAAKPIIDIDLVVKDSSDELSYLPVLEAAGYVLRVREPGWHEHRMMRTPEADVHVHIFSPGAPELERHVRFRNRLRVNEEDRDLYGSTKRRLATLSWESMDAYSEAKTEVIEGILARSTTTQAKERPIG